MNSFPFTDLTQLEHEAPLPASSDVVIIGGGVIGVSTALYLADKGISVTLLEKGRVAGEQSSRNWGWIRKQGRDPDELPIVMEACRLWPQLAAETGEDIGLKQTGVTYLAETAAQMARFEKFMMVAKAHDLDTRLIDGKEVAGMIKGMSRSYAGAMTTPSDMRAEPWIAVPALARLAVRKSVTIIEGCAARALDQAGGKVTGVWTEKGRIAASSVLVAGGAWSSLFLRRHGVAVPQLSVRSTVAATEALPEVHSGAAIDDKIAFRRRQDGGYTIAGGVSNLLYIGPDAFRNMFKYMPALFDYPLGTRYWPAAPQAYPDAWSTPRNWQPDQPSPFERMRVLSPQAGQHDLAAILRGFKGLFPQFGDVKLKKTWAGMIDAMPDVVPVIDRVEKVPGLFVATGMSGHGFGIGPGVGRVMADLIQNNAPGHNMRRFRLERFSDGSAMRPGPAV